MRFFFAVALQSRAHDPRQLASALRLHHINIQPEGIFIMYVPTRFFIILYAILADYAIESEK